MLALPSVPSRRLSASCSVFWFLHCLFLCEKWGRGSYLLARVYMSCLHFFSLEEGKGCGCGGGQGLWTIRVGACTFISLQSIVRASRSLSSACRYVQVILSGYCPRFHFFALRLYVCPCLSWRAREGDVSVRMSPAVGVGV